MKLLRTLAFCFVVINAVSAQTIQDKPEIPSGVNYKLATDEINAAAKVLLEKALGGDSAAWQQLFSGIPTCGPMLWQALKPSAPKTLIDAKTIIMVISTPTAVTTEGRGFVTEQARRDFWTILIKNYPTLSTARVRKARSNEISYYWATIPFDIEEPFFAFEAGPNVFIANLRNENGKIRLLWIDLVGDLRSLKPQMPSDETGKSIVETLSKDAERQTPETMFRAGKSYLSGNGVAVDVEKGRSLVDEAAQKGLLDAQLLLGFAYFSGTYLPKDRAKAAPYLMMAAQQGHAMAQFYIGMMYLQGAGLEKSAENARLFLQKSADQNLAVAQYNLGAMYFQGIGIPADKTKACALYEKASDQGQLEAMNDLGWCYQQGEGVEKDPAKAMALYQKAAERGHPRGQGNLAMMYVASGEWEKAYFWLRIAENKGGTEARPAIENAKKHMTQNQIDLVESKIVEWQNAHKKNP